MSDAVMGTAARRAMPGYCRMVRQYSGEWGVSFSRYEGIQALTMDIIISSRINIIRACNPDSDFVWNDTPVCLKFILLDQPFFTVVFFSTGVQGHRHGFQSCLKGNLFPLYMNLGKGFRVFI